MSQDDGGSNLTNLLKNLIKSNVDNNPLLKNVTENDISQINSRINSNILNHESHTLYILPPAEVGQMELEPKDIEYLREARRDSREIIDIENPNVDLKPLILYPSLLL